MYGANDAVDHRAYTFCVLDQLREALRRRDVFVTPSWRYADPRRNLLAGAEWEAARPIMCRTLGYSPRPEPILAALSDELDQTYRAVAARLPNNPAVRFERIDGKDELIVSPLDKVEEPASLVALRTAIAGRLPRVDLPEILLEIAARTDFAVAFTHVSERAARVTDLGVSVCAVLLAEACNTGLEPLVRHETQSLRRDRLSWVSQNYLRDETLRAANARLVAAQTGIPLARAWGGGEVASADGLRFVVPVRTVHAGPNPKYFGIGRGVTYYNLVSDQFTGLHGITVPGDVARQPGAARGRARTTSPSCTTPAAPRRAPRMAVAGVLPREAGRAASSRRRADGPGARRVPADCRRFRGRGQARPFGLSDLAAVLATVLPAAAARCAASSPTRSPSSAGVSMR